MYKAIIMLVVFIGILLVVVDVIRIKSGLVEKEPEIIYRYIPRTFEDEQLDPIFVTDIFKTMFSQPSPWVGSVRTYERRKQERINQYFVSQL